MNGWKLCNVIAKYKQSRIVIAQTQGMTQDGGFMINSQCGFAENLLIPCLDFSQDAIVQSESGEETGNNGAVSVRDYICSFLH